MDSRFPFLPYRTSDRSLDVCRELDDPGGAGHQVPEGWGDTPQAWREHVGLLVSDLAIAAPQLLDHGRSIAWLRDERFIELVRGAATTRHFQPNPLATYRIDRSLGPLPGGHRLSSQARAAYIVREHRQTHGLVGLEDLVESTASDSLRAHALLVLLNEDRSKTRIPWARLLASNHRVVEFRKYCITATARVHRSHGDTPPWLESIATDRQQWAGARSAAITELLATWFEPGRSLQWARDHFADEETIDAMIAVMNGIVAGNAEDPELLPWLRSIASDKTRHSYIWSRALRLLALDYTGPFPGKLEWAESLASNPLCPYSREYGLEVITRLDPSPATFGRLEQLFLCGSGSETERALKNLLLGWPDDPRIPDLIFAWSERPGSLKSTAAMAVVASAIKHFPADQRTLEFAEQAIEKPYNSNPQTFLWVADQKKTQPDFDQWLARMATGKRNGIAVQYRAEHLQDDPEIEKWLRSIVAQATDPLGSSAALALAHNWACHHGAFAKIISLVDLDPPISPPAKSAFVGYLLSRWPDTTETLNYVIKSLREDKIERYALFDKLLPYWHSNSEFISALKEDALRTENFEEGCGCDDRHEAWDALSWIAPNNPEVRQWLSAHLDNPDPELRKFAIYALTDASGDGETLRRIEPLAKGDPDAEVAAEALGRWAGMQHADPHRRELVLREILESNRDDKHRAAAALAILRTPGNHKLATELVLTDPSTSVRFFALSYLGRPISGAPPAAVTEIMKKAFENDRASWIQRTALDWLIARPEFATYLLDWARAPINAGQVADRICRQLASGIRT